MYKEEIEDIEEEVFDQEGRYTQHDESFICETCGREVNPKTSSCAYIQCELYDIRGDDNGDLYREI